MATPVLRDTATSDKINCFDPCTGALLGSGVSKALSAAEVKLVVAKAREAQEKWRLTTFAQRKFFFTQSVSTDMNIKILIVEQC